MTRKEAKAQYLKVYEGKPCYLGHTVRYTSSGGCVICTKARYHNDPEYKEKVKKRNRERYRKLDSEAKKKYIERVQARQKALRDQP